MAASITFFSNRVISLTHFCDKLGPVLRAGKVDVNSPEAPDEPAAGPSKPKFISKQNRASNSIIPFFDLALEPNRAQVDKLLQCCSPIVLNQDGPGQSDSSNGGRLTGRKTHLLFAMKFLPLTCLFAALGLTVFSLQSASLNDIPLKDIDGKDASLKAYSGKVLLIVNVASKCGYRIHANPVAPMESRSQYSGENALTCADSGVPTRPFKNGP